MAALPADDGEAVLGKIMADGTFDDLRQQLVVQLKQNVRTLLQLPPRCNRRQTVWECTIVEHLLALSFCYALQATRRVYAYAWYNVAAMLLFRSAVEVCFGTNLIGLLLL